MKKILLASAGVMVISAGSVYAACIPTPSCASLGYESSSSCEGGTKCPFGNAWNCTLVNKITEITTEITEIKKVIEEGGVGGGGNTQDCAVGSIFYSDISCSYGKVVDGKTPIGVVVYVDGTGGGQAMALKSIGNYTWGGYGTDIPGLNNFTSDSSASTDLQSCSNTVLITAAGDKSTYPAAWAAHEYKTAGTNASDWCLPAAGIMFSIKKSMSAINAGFVLAGGDQLGTSSSLWSSSEYNSDHAWYSLFGSYYGLGTSYYYPSYYDGYRSKGDSAEVRPVLEF